MLHVSAAVLAVFIIYVLSARTFVTCISIADTMLKINVTYEISSIFTGIAYQCYVKLIF